LLAAAALLLAYVLIFDRHRLAPRLQAAVPAFSSPAAAR
jgi:hypothetical protein